jgi:hypothetical protein
MQGRFMSGLVILFVLTFVQNAHGQGSDGAGPRGAQAPMFDSSKVKVSFEDRLAIQDLFARYSQALDAGNGVELVNNVFAPNGTFHDPSLCLIGSDELRKGLASHEPHAKTSQHWPNNIVITEMSAAGDQAKTHSYVLIAHVSRGVSTIGTYTDTLVKIDGRWRILHREVWRPGEIKLDPRCPVDTSKLEP